MRSLKYELVKRAIDLSFSIIGLVVLAPLFLIVAILVKLDSPGPVFFRQTRVGRNFVPFTIIKFRTMQYDASGSGLASNQRNEITRAGLILRRTKIDELPQLINILKGDMSLVGPRPELPKYVGMFESDYEKILKIKPGITDYAAIKFKDEEGILKKYADPEEVYIKDVLPVKIDLYKRYLEDKGFLTDMKVILSTFLLPIVKKS